MDVKESKLTKLIARISLLYIGVHFVYLFGYGAIQSYNKAYEKPLSTLGMNLPIKIKKKVLKTSMPISKYNGLCTVSSDQLNYHFYYKETKFFRKPGELYVRRNIGCLFGILD